MRNLNSKLNLAAVLLSAGAITVAFGQSAPQGKTLAASAGVFAYPAKGQKPEKQAQDEAECYNWAKQQSGYDPMQPPPPPTAQPTQAQTGPTADGSRAKGALRGAAAGAIIGEVANNDASEGAAIGAVVGTMAGGRRSRQAQAQQQQQAQAQQQASVDQAKAAQQQQAASFKSGMGVCLQARGYAVN